MALRPSNRHPLRLLGATLSAFVLLLAACASDEAIRVERAAPTAIPAPAGVDAQGAPVTLEVVDGGAATGQIITDHRGFAVYGIVGETPSELVCTNDCLASWIPVAPRAGTVAAGLDEAFYGAINRPDGIAQATYSDVPLYTWTGDTEIGITGGAGVAGVWFALTEQGGFVAPTDE